MPQPPTLSELYADAPSSAQLQLIAPPRLGWSPRTWSAIIACCFLPGILLLVDLKLDGPVFRLSSALFGPAVDIAWIGCSAVGALFASVAWLVLVVANGWRAERGPGTTWDRWAAARGFVRTDSAALDDVMHLPMTERSKRRWMRARHVFRGRLVGVAEPVTIGAARWDVPSGRASRRLRSYVVLAELSPRAAQVFPECRMTRMVRWLRSPAAETGDPWSPGRELRFEASALDEQAEVRVLGGEDIAWYTLFDPVLLDGLARELDVEFQQRGRWLAVVAPKYGWWRRRTASARVDTLARAAQLLVGRYEEQARLAELGKQADERQLAGNRQRTRTAGYLERERAHDLALTPAEQMAELARFVSPEELADVQAKIDSGQFPAEWIDDLLHHKRAAFWAARSDVDAA